MKDEQIQQLPVNRLKTEAQVRYRQVSDEILRGVAQTMTEVGQLSPIRARRLGDELIVVDGHIRLAAAKLAGFSTVAVIIEEKELCEAEVIHRQIIANCMREDLTCFEKARAIRRLLKETGWTATQAAAKLGFSNATVSRLLALLELPDEICEQIEGGTITASAGYELARVQNAQEQTDLAIQVAGGHLTRDALVGKLKSQRRQNAEPSPRVCPHRVTAVLGAGRSITICGSGITLESLIQWLEELTAKARKVRPQGIEITTFIKMLRDQAKA